MKYDILLIEDSEDYGQFLTTTIENSFDVTIASNLAVAIKYLKGKVFDLVVTDLNLPDSQGLKTFEWVQHYAYGTPIVVLTGGYEEVKKVSEVIGLGAEDYLFKSDLKVKTIERTLCSAIERYRIKYNLNRALMEKTKELEKAVDFATELAKVQSWILENRFDEEEIDYLIGKFGRVANVDRVYIFNLDLVDESLDKSFLVQSHEWCDKDVEPQCDNPLLGHYPLVKDGERSICYDLFENGHPLQILTKDVLTFDRPTLEEQNIKSILFVPLVCKGKACGFIGFDDCHTERVWSSLEINILKVLANLIVWVKKQIESFEKIKIMSKRADEEINKIKLLNDKLDKQISGSMVT